jgi:hypothetical protein
MCKLSSMINDVVRDALVLVQEGKLSRASFPPWWNDVV